MNEQKTNPELCDPCTVKQAGNQMQNHKQQRAGRSLRSISTFLVVLTFLLLISGCSGEEGTPMTSAGGSDSSGPVSGKEPSPNSGDAPSGAQEHEPDLAALSFDSFDGGGPVYEIEIKDPDILSCQETTSYHRGDHDSLDGGSYTVTFTLTGLQPGTTEVTVHAHSPIDGDTDDRYRAVVDDPPMVRLTALRTLEYLSINRCSREYDTTDTVELGEDGYVIQTDTEEPHPLPSETADALIDLIDEYDLLSWDGFDESMDGVPDGEAFSIEIRFTDGTGIEACGDNAFPEHYDEAVTGIQKLLEQVESDG